MKLTGNFAFAVFLILISSYVVYSASHWSFKTGFFPMAVAIPLIVVALVYLGLELLGGLERAGEPVLEAEFSQEVAPQLARRRALALFSWIGGFIVLVFLIGFPVAVPLFIFLYLRIQSELSWSRSIALTAVTWGLFYIVFQRVVKLQFESGAVQTWLGI
jgi:hypothetical protein